MRCLLTFFLKTVEENNYISLIKATEHPINVALIFNSDFIKSVCAFNVLEEFLRNSLGNCHHKQNIIDFFLHFSRLLVEKLPEIILVVYDLSNQFHSSAVGAKLTNNGTRQRIINLKFAVSLIEDLGGEEPKE